MTADQRGSTGSAIKCADARVLLMGFIDGELSADEARQIEDHFAVCPACRGELATYQQLGRAADSLAKEEPFVNTDLAWERIYDRIARGAGWLLLWVGITLMAGWGLWVFASEFLVDPDVPLVMRLGVGAFALGCLLLLVNILRERLYRRKTDRYDEVIR
jgi:predicted anti-sigma-YlaC factor YlaD